MGIAEIRGETFCVWGWVGVLLDQLNQSLWWMISAKTRIVSTDVLSLVIYSGAYIYVGLDRFSDYFFPFELFLFYLQLTFESNGRQCVYLRPVHYENNYCWQLTRTSHVFKQLYDVSVHETRTQTRPYMRPVETLELRFCFFSSFECT